MSGVSAATVHELRGQPVSPPTVRDGQRGSDMGGSQHAALWLALAAASRAHDARKSLAFNALQHPAQLLIAVRCDNTTCAASGDPETMSRTTTRLTAAVQEYFADLRRVRASGGATQERSLYGPLGNLLTAVGATLRPKVFCVQELADQGAGHPDFGLFSVPRPLTRISGSTRGS